MSKQLFIFMTQVNFAFLVRSCWRGGRGGKIRLRMILSLRIKKKVFAQYCGSHLNIWHYQIYIDICTQFIEAISLRDLLLFLFMSRTWTIQTFAGPLTLAKVLWYWNSNNNNNNNNNIFESKANKRNYDEIIDGQVKKKEYIYDD